MHTVRSFKSSSLSAVFNFYNVDVFKAIYLGSPGTQFLEDAMDLPYSNRACMEKKTEANKNNSTTTPSNQFTFTATNFVVCIEPLRIIAQEVINVTDSD
ncbi:hypothetical protein OsI_28105 [Oryza sativa Indica Group]|uniref:Uncharacterized protein n=1 Tax=Oryza sativa subsp. indica TaxID=39946 RepID=B8BBF9_ORYSI|nr:hypothetical protein OsI_28105 [Oryza sativa Indica Group]